MNSNQFTAINLIGTITTQAPVSITLPDVKGMPKDNQGDAYLPASSLRGVLRHRAIEYAQELRANSENTLLSVDQVYMLAQGVDTAREYENLKTGGLSVEIGVNNRFRKNPHMSLFGRWQMKGKLSVGNAFSKTPGIAITGVYGSGARSHVFERSESLLSHVPSQEMEYLGDILSADANTASSTADYKEQQKQLKKQLRTADAADKAIINAQLEELDTLIRAVKDARVGSSESIRRPIEGFEAIAPSVTLSHRFRLLNPTNEEFNYFLWCLSLFASNPTLGGHTNLGCGLVHGEWLVTVTQYGEFESKVIGFVQINDDGFVLEAQPGYEPWFNPASIQTALKAGELDLSVFE